MQQQKKVHPTSIIQTSIIASVAGLITLSCTSFASYGEQQPTQGQNSLTINTSRENISANTSEEVSLQTNMAYREARLLVMQQGWRPNLQGEAANLQSTAVKELFDLGYKEIKDCAGSGEGACRFEFVNNKGELLVVTAITRGYENTRRFVKKWWIEKNTNNNQISQQNLFPTIADGYYALGGTGQGLEVRGKQYRYYDEEGQKPWQSINYLQSINNGLVFDGQNYWCLSTLAPPGKPAVCSAYGWIQVTIPFIGTKRYNFLGGIGTVQSITIQNDGRVIIKTIGTQDTEVIYRGQFTNPLMIENEFGLLIQGNKIYQLDVNGKMTKGCKGEDKVCESELY